MSAALAVNEDLFSTPVLRTLWESHDESAPESARRALNLVQNGISFDALWRTAFGTGEAPVQTESAKAGCWYVIGISAARTWGRCKAWMDQKGQSAARKAKMAEDCREALVLMTRAQNELKKCNEPALAKQVRDMEQLVMDVGARGRKFRQELWKQSKAFLSSTEGKVVRMPARATSSRRSVFTEAHA
ncbi:MAG: hypothetical protein AB7G06_03065 [Bdellovibrionales bacterium]